MRKQKQQQRCSAQNARLLLLYIDKWPFFAIEGFLSLFSLKAEVSSVLVRRALPLYDIKRVAMWWCMIDLFFGLPTLRGRCLHGCGIKHSLIMEATSISVMQKPFFLAVLIV